MQTSGDGLTVVLTTDVVELSTQVVVHLCEVSLLVGSLGIAERSLPVVSEVLVVLHQLHA